MIIIIISIIVVNVTNFLCFLIFLLTSVVQKKFHVSTSSLEFDAFLNFFSYCMILGGTSVSEDNKELNQLHSAEGWNTLHHAARGRDTDTISLIHTHLPNIESKTNKGYTPLMVAALHGKVDAVKWFLEKGATVTCEDNRGLNTLHYAALGGDTDIISPIHTHLPNVD